VCLCIDGIINSLYILRTWLELMDQLRLDNNLCSLCMSSLKATLHAGDAVQLHGLLRSADLNGHIGECDKWHSEAGRWSVRLQDGKQVSVLAANLCMVSHHTVFAKVLHSMSQFQEKVQQATAMIAASIIVSSEIEDVVRDAAASVEQGNRLAEKARKLKTKLAQLRGELSGIRKFYDSSRAAAAERKAVERHEALLVGYDPNSMDSMDAAYHDMANSRTSLFKSSESLKVTIKNYHSAVADARIRRSVDQARTAQNEADQKAAKEHAESIGKFKLSQVLLKKEAKTVVMQPDGQLLLKEVPSSSDATMFDKQNEVGAFFLVFLNRRWKRKTVHSSQKDHLPFG
jgi:hypothetical protein